MKIPVFPRGLLVALISSHSKFDGNLPPQAHIDFVANFRGAARFRGEAAYFFTHLAGAVSHLSLSSKEGTPF